ncbi:MAG: class I SAM-dependent methyltransferase [Inconstantimicrobium porci]|uniref:class I SAM-dependent methyltransferase n=1 Tax=Inconstantimicrobium porci TaxID=2652291 RepID=UPI002A9154EE|nr:class I SAM-dependent methyltransferase [Inconstantimicrobium porci]MDY5910685.1 class I SAM-dependent methyltransferase [Inconstantimicrobium porci]
MNSLNYFNEIAPKWNGIRKSYFKNELSEMIVKRISIENKTIADLGCGTGFITMKIAQYNPHAVFAVDQSLNMLQEVRKESLKRGIANIFPIRSNLDNLDIFDDTVDYITINMALHHVKDAKKCIDEMYRILKPGGKVVIGDVCEHNGEWARKEMFDEWLGFSNTQILEWLNETGFTEIKLENTSLRAIGYSSKGECIDTGIFIAEAIK